MKDLYKILGVSRGASPAEIKSAYRKLAKELHPDRNPDDPIVAERFKEVSAAYRILGDEKTKGRYDRGEIDESGQERAAYGFSGGDFGGGPAGGGFGAGRGRAAGGGPFGGGGEDIFSDIFGGFRRGGRGAMRAKGEDRKYALRIDFLEAVRGGKRRLKLADGRAIDANIPKGIKDGQQIRLKGQGDPGRGGGPAGDALIEIEVAPHPLFTRKGDDILVELPVTLPEAVLGARIRVPTIDGSVNLSVPKGSNTGTTLRLKGKGAAAGAGGARGDQLVRLKIVLPDKPDPELEKLVARWAKGKSYDVRGDFPAE